MECQKLLVVDDSQDIHDLVAAMLAGEPLEVHPALTAAEGLAAAHRIDPDLILLDVDLPDVSGMEICRQLKQHPATRDIPVVFLTGMTEPRQRLKGLELGADDYIIKPFDPAQLLARVRVLLRSRQLTKLLVQKASVLRESEARFRVLAENSSDIITRQLPDGRYLYVSPACRTILGYDPENLIGRRVYEFVHPDDVWAVASCQTGAPAGGRTNSVDFRFRLPGGGYIWLEKTCRLVHADGELSFEVHASSREITARKNAQFQEAARTEVLEMIAQDRQIEDILRRLVVAIEQTLPSTRAAALVPDGGIARVVDGSFPPLLAASLQTRAGSMMVRLASCEADPAVVLTDADPDWAFIVDAAPTLACRIAWYAPIRAADPAGAFLVLPPTACAPDATAKSVLAMSTRLAAVAIDRIRLHQRLMYQAQHDALTGLPNRTRFEQLLQDAIERCRARGTTAAVLFIDVDRFKYVNDTFGHRTGDELLCQLVQRLCEVTGGNSTIARMGGDEFALILPDLPEPSHAHPLARALVDAFAHPLNVLGQSLYATISIGLSFCPADGTDVATLQKHADTAMYRAKNSGRNQFRNFVPGSSDDVRVRMEFENDLRRAVGGGQLRLLYQPKVDRDRRVVGLEALLRWQHPTKGLVSPGAFIPVAEETGLIIPIGEWVLEQTSRQILSWLDAGVPAVPVACNVSAMQFAQDEFLFGVERMLKRYPQVVPYLDIELTESLLMHNTRDAAAKLGRLKELGLSIAIDDFGTGYSSLAYLHSLPIDTLKIDRSFVSVIRPEHDPRLDDGETAVIRAIAALARSLRMWTVAEGVETEAQQAYLSTLGAGLMQGFLFCPPVSADHAEHILRHGLIPVAPIARSA